MLKVNLYKEFVPKMDKKTWVTTKLNVGPKIIDKKQLGVWRARRLGTQIKVSFTKSSYVDVVRKELPPLKRVKFDMLNAKVAPEEVPFVDTPRSSIDRSKLHYDVERLLRQERLLLETISRKKSRINHRNVMKQLTEFSQDMSTCKSILLSEDSNSMRSYCKALEGLVVQAESDGLLSLGIKASTISDLERLISSIPSKIDVNVGVQSPLLAIRSLLDSIWSVFEAQPILSSVVALALTAILIPVIGWKNATMFLIVGSTALGLYKYGPTIFDYVKQFLVDIKLIQGEDVVKPQVEFDFQKYNKVLEVTGGFVTSVLLGLTCAKSISKSDASSFIACVSRADKISANISDGIDWILSLFTGVLDWIDGKIKLPEWLMERLPRPQDRNPEFYQLYEKTTKFIEAMTKNFDVNMAEEANLLYTELNVYYASIERVHEMSSFRTDIQQLRQAMMPLLQCFQGASSTNNTRFRTVWFNFTGESGVGKSSFLNDLALLVFSARSTPDEWERYSRDKSTLTFPYSPDIDFWTNYKNQFCTMIDELGLVVDVAGVNNDGWMQLIRMVNIFVMPLDMPDIPRKGKITFNSKLLLTTTNRRHISTLKNISHVPAIHSRCAANLAVAPSREYAISNDGKPLSKDRSNWKLNVPKLIADKRNKVYRQKFDGDKPHLEFRVRDMKTAEFSGVWFSYYDMYQRVLEAYDDAHELTTSIIKDSSDLFSKLDANRVGGVRGPVEILEKGTYVHPPIRVVDPNKDEHELMMEAILQEEFENAVEIDPFEKGSDDSEPIDEEYYSSDEADNDNPIHIKPQVETDSMVSKLYSFVTSPFYKDTFGMTGIDRAKAAVLAAPESGVYGVLENCADDLRVAMLSKKMGSFTPNELKILSQSLGVPFEKIEQLGKEFGRVQGRENIFIDKVKEMNDDVLTEREVYLLSEVLGVDADLVFECAQVYGPVKTTCVGDFVDYLHKKVITPKLRLMSQVRKDWISQLRSFLGFALPILGVFTTMATIYNLWHGSTIDKKIEGTELFESAIPSNLNDEVKPMSGKAQKGGRKWAAVLQGEFFDTLAFNQTKITYNNVLVCYVHTSPIMRGHVFALGSGVFLAFSHYFSSAPADQDCAVVLYNLDGSEYHRTTIKGIMADSELERPLSDDIVSIVIRKQPKKKIVNKFALRESSVHALPANGTAQGTLMKWSNNSGFRTYLQVPVKLSNVKKVRVPALWNSEGKSELEEDNYTVNFAVSADVRTEEGSCGLPYFDAKGEIVGIHCAGSESVGFAVALCREDIARIIERRGLKNEEPPIVPLDMKPVCVPGTGLHAEVGLQHGLVGIMPYSHCAPKSNIKPTKYFDVFKPKYRPAMVSASVLDDGLYDPQKLARMKVSSVEMATPSLLMRVAADHQSRSVLANITTAPCGRRLLTFDEAIDGIPGVLGSLPRKTSPGYPYSTENRAGGKRHWIGEAGKTTETDAQVKFRQDCYDELNEAMDGIRPTNFFKDAMKVELREPHKVMTPRQICAYSMKGSVNCRRLTGAFVAAYVGSNFNVGSALGMNVHGPDFEVYIRKICSNGPSIDFVNKIFADYKMFDRLQIMKLGEYFTDMVNDFYAGEDPSITRARTLYLMDVYNSYHVANIETTNVPTSAGFHVNVNGELEERPIPKAQSEVEVPHYGTVCNVTYTSRISKGVTVYTVTVLYIWYGGTSSGYPLTTIFNDYCNHCYTRMGSVGCVLDIPATVDIVETQIVEAREIMTKQNYITFGDDHVISVHPDNLDKITFRNMKKWITSMGMGYTPANKEGVDYDHLSIYDSSFLKRTAVYSNIHGRHVGYLPLEVIENIPCWYDADGACESTRERVCEYFKELSYHMEDVFRVGKNKILPHLSPNHMPDSLDWKVNFMMVTSNDSVYF